MPRRDPRDLLRRLAPRRARPWLAFGALLVLLGCATAGGPPAAGVTKGDSDRRRPLIAVLPFENLSAAPAPLKEIRSSYTERLRQRGVNLLGEAELLSLMTRHRIRYTGGVDRDEVEAFRREAGVEGILITSLERYEDQNPPKVVLVSRLASSDTPSMVRWADSVAMSGDDAPGILGLGLVESMKELMPKALERLAGSLSSHMLSGAPPSREAGRAGRFRPRSFYRAPGLKDDRRYSVAVLPVVNRGDRKYAGELLAGILIEHLMRAGAFDVLEPGMVREDLLKYRIVSPEGASLDTVELFSGRLPVDLFVTGRVMDYDDARGSGEAPRVTFSVQIIESRGKQVVWSSHSTNRGNDGVFLFGMGNVTTAHALASRMVAEVMREMRKAGSSPAGTKRDRGERES